MELDDFDAEDLSDYIARPILSFIADFEISLDHLGGSFNGTLRCIPEQIFPIIDAVAYSQAEAFVAAHGLDPKHRLYDEAALAGHNLQEMLAFLLKFAWQRGYLMYRFYKHENRLPPPAESVDCLKIVERIGAFMVDRPDDPRSHVETFLQHAMSFATEGHVLQRAVVDMGSGIFSALMLPRLDGWTHRVALAMALGMLAARAELDMETEAARVPVSGDHNAVVAAHTIAHSLDNISQSVATLARAGEPTVATALTKVKDSLKETTELSVEKRAELLQLLENISQQAALPKEERLNSSTLRILLTGFTATAGTASGFAEVWSTWGPEIGRFLGL